MLAFALFLDETRKHAIKIERLKDIREFSTPFLEPLLTNNRDIHNI